MEVEQEGLEPTSKWVVSGAGSRLPCTTQYQPHVYRVFRNVSTVGRSMSLLGDSYWTVQIPLTAFLFCYLHSSDL